MGRTPRHFLSATYFPLHLRPEQSPSHFLGQAHLVKSQLKPRDKRGPGAKQRSGPEVKVLWAQQRGKKILHPLGHLRHCRSD